MQLHEGDRVVFERSPPAWLCDRGQGRPLELSTAPTFSEARHDEPCTAPAADNTVVCVSTPYNTPPLSSPSDAESISVASANSVSPSGIPSPVIDLKVKKIMIEYILQSR